jgi:hypothetical protein
MDRNKSRGRRPVTRSWVPDADPTHHIEKHRRVEEKPTEEEEEEEGEEKGARDSRTCDLVCSCEKCKARSRSSKRSPSEDGYTVRKTGEFICRCEECKLPGSRPVGIFYLRGERWTKAEPGKYKHYWLCKDCSPEGLTFDEETGLYNHPDMDGRVN